MKRRRSWEQMEGMVDDKKEQKDKTESDNNPFSMTHQSQTNKDKTSSSHSETR